MRRVSLKILLITVVITVSSCTSIKGTLVNTKLYTPDSCKASIEGVYKNHQLDYVPKDFIDTLIGPTYLWDYISAKASSKKSKINFSDGSKISISKKNKRTYEAVLIDTNIRIKPIKLRGKEVENYFALNRKTFTFPIPFFSLHQERRVLLTRLDDKYLIAKEEDFMFLWAIIIAGSSRNYDEHLFKIVE